MKFSMMIFILNIIAVVGALTIAGLLAWQHEYLWMGKILAGGASACLIELVLIGGVQLMYVGEGKQ